jgi:4'-phosphopantetheinyl transferase
MPFPDDCAAGSVRRVTNPLDPLADAVDVHLASTSLVADPDVARRCRALLTADESAACDAFRDEADRRSALVARALARTTLSRYASVAPDAWRFERAAGGRPEIASPTGTRLRFNLSHTRELVACAVALDAEVGVDVERVADHADLLDLAATVMSDDEFAAFRRLPSADRPRRFFATWTLKEAYLKARGVGLALSPKTIRFDWSAAGRVHATFDADARDDPSQWWFALSAAEADHLLALSVRGSGPAPTLRVLRLDSIEGRPAAVSPSWLAASAPPGSDPHDFPTARPSV